MAVNEFGQTLGEPVEGWSTRPMPKYETLKGKYCTLVELERKHWPELWEGHELDGPSTWTYIPDGPPNSYEEFEMLMERRNQSVSDRITYAIVKNSTGKAVGTVSLFRTDPANGSVEMGYVQYTHFMRRSVISTECQYLAMRHVFEDLGYRRYEWRCNSLNTPSEKSALRLGFQYEGKFRQAHVFKGLNRDTLWFSILDKEWPVAKKAFELWLAPENFDSKGNQIHKLEDLRAQEQKKQEESQSS